MPQSAASAPFQTCECGHLGLSTLLPFTEGNCVDEPGKTGKGITAVTHRFMREIAELFSKMVVLFYIPTSSV